MSSRNITIEVNKYFKEVRRFKELKEEQCILTIEASKHFKVLSDNLFICRFLYDCVNKGLEYQRDWIDKHKGDIAKKINPEEAQRIPQDFEVLEKNRDLILVLAYEFFINYLVTIIRVSLYKNPTPLKTIKEIKYKGSELVDKLANNTLNILDDLINILIFDSKEDGSLKIYPKHWIWIIEKMQEVEIKESHKAFWRALGIRRNASSHITARTQWEKIENTLDHTDILVWLYSILFLGYTIDVSLCKKYHIETNEITVNFSGEPIYYLQKVSL